MLTYEATSTRFHGAGIEPEAMRAVRKRAVGVFLDPRFSTASRERAEAAEEKVAAALDRLDAELEGREYLATDRFSVADLTAAARLYPLVLRPQTPWRPSRLPRVWAEFQEAQRERPSLEWVAETYRRHRG